MSDDVAQRAAATPSSATQRSAMSRVALWLSIVALVATVALVIPFIAPRNPAYVPLFVVAFAGAIVGLVFAVRARGTSVAGRRTARWALVSSIVALVVDAVLVVIFIVAIVGVTSLAEVELRGQGPNDITVTYSSQIEEVTLQWPSEGRAEFNTEGDWAEIVVTAPEGDDDQTVSCQIVWNDEVVIDETSDTGSVTCRYDEG